MTAPRKSPREEWKTATPAMRTATILALVAMFLLTVWFVPVALHIGEHAVR